MKRKPLARNVSAIPKSAKLELNTDDFENMDTDEKILVLSRTIEEMYGLLQDIASSKALDDWIPQAEAERLTGLSKTTLHLLRSKGEITYSRFADRKVFYRRSDLVRYLDRREKMRA